ncbi:MAG: SDR family oxidoreductase [Abitibacteriaceae bacterium]|nr:SDR family oxidoreductase [Abditibacteriaceae bacterium]MBV9867013.1 SDR family oxidoreductase [Abditibacteriaceae bacterium]
MKNLNGQVAIISGGLGDIGQAIAHELAQRGAAIALGDILPPESAPTVIQELQQWGQQARYDVVDVSDATAVTDWVQCVEDALGVPTLIIPNAAVVTLKDIRTITPVEWNRELRINLDGAYHLAQAGALRLLHHHKPGRIVFIGSWAAHAPHAYIPAYCAAKAGIRTLARCMALDLAPEGILVNEVAPGWVNAGLTADVWVQQPERRIRALAQVPVRHLIEPAEVAVQVAHLCDPDNRHMTGSTLLMDGGLSLLST